MAINIQERCCADSAAKKKWIIGGGVAGVTLVVVIIIVLAVTLSGNFVGHDVLKEVPLIDGRNDLPSNLYNVLKNDLSQFNFTSNLNQSATWQAISNAQTDLPRLKEGMVGGQFWVASAPCTSNYKDAVARTLDQIDVIKRLVNQYPEELQYTTTADGISKAFSNKKIASLIAVAGGHSIDSRMGNLRMFYELGARYMTLTQNCDTPWANSHLIDLQNNTKTPIGLTSFGKEVIVEMNRLGMIIDISHVSKQVMSEALLASTAPVIFSHSAAASIFANTQNVPDDIIRRLKANEGIIMLNLHADLISTTNATMAKLIEHLEFIRDIHGNADHLGLGSDFDGPDGALTGLEDVSKFPDLFDRLAERGWTRDELKKLAGENLIRVFKAVEAVRDNLLHKLPYQKLIPDEDLRASDQTQECRTDFIKTTTTP